MANAVIFNFEISISSQNNSIHETWFAGTDYYYSRWALLTCQWFVLSHNGNQRVNGFESHLMCMPLAEGSTKTIVRSLDRPECSNPFVSTAYGQFTTLYVPQNVHLKILQIWLKPGNNDFSDDVICTKWRILMYHEDFQFYSRWNSAFFNSWSIRYAGNHE